MSVTFGGLTVEVGGEVDLAFVAAVRDMVDELYRAEHAALETEKGIEALAEAAGVSVEDYKRATAAMAEVEAASAKTSQQNVKQSMSWTELNSALEVAKKGYGAALSIINQVSSAITTVTTLAAEQDRLNRVQERFGLNLREAASASSEYISQLQLAETAAKMQAAGLQVSQQELAAFAAVAGDYAHNTGEDLAGVIDQLTQGLIAGEQEGLRRFGPALGAMAGEAHTARERLDALTRVAGGLTPVAESAASAWARFKGEMEQAGREAAGGLTTGFQSVTREMARYREQQERLAGVAVRVEEDFRSLGETLGNWLGEVVAFGRAITDLWTAMHRFDEVGTRARAGLAAFSQRWGDALLSVMGFTPAVTAATTAVDRQAASMQRAAAQAADYARELDRLAGRSGGALVASRGPTYRTAAGGYGPVDEGDLSEAERDALNRRLNAEEQSRFAKAEAHARSERERRRGGGGSGTDTEMDRLRQRGVDQAMADLRRREADAARDFAFREVEADAIIDRAERQRVALEQHRQAWIQDQVSARRAEMDRERERARERATQSKRESFGEQFELAFTETKTVAERTAEAVKAAFTGMTQAFTSHVMALAEGRESLKEALNGIASDSIMALAKVAQQEAAYQFAMALGSLAIGAWGKAGLHAAAGAGLLVVAAGAGYAASAIAPKPAAPSSAAPVSTPGGGGSSGGGGGGNTTVTHHHYYSPVIGNREATDSDVGDQLSRYQPRTRRARS